MVLIVSGHLVIVYNHPLPVLPLLDQPLFVCVSQKESDPESITTLMSHLKINNNFLLLLEQLLIWSARDPSWPSVPWDLSRSCRTGGNWFMQGLVSSVAAAQSRAQTGAAVRAPPCCPCGHVSGKALGFPLDLHTASRRPPLVKD